jgi:hypothetical protein
MHQAVYMENCFNYFAMEYPLFDNIRCKIATQKVEFLIDNIFFEFWVHIFQQNNPHSYGIKLCHTLCRSFLILFIISVFAWLYVRARILVTCGKNLEMSNVWINAIFKTVQELKFPRRSLDWYRLNCKNASSCIYGKLF